MIKRANVIILWIMLLILPIQGIAASLCHCAANKLAEADCHKIHYGAAASAQPQHHQHTLNSASLVNTDQHQQDSAQQATHNDHAHHLCCAACLGLGLPAHLGLSYVIQGLMSQVTTALPVAGLGVLPDLPDKPPRHRFLSPIPPRGFYYPAYTA